MSPLTQLHALTVHFPIALLFASVALELAALYPRWQQALRPAALVTLILGAVGSVAAVLTAPEDNGRGVTQLMRTHEQWARIAMIAFVALALWRLFLVWRRRPFTGVQVAAYLLAAAFGLGALGYTGYLGGKMVYEEAVGVQRNGLPVAPPRAPGSFRRP